MLGHFGFIPYFCKQITLNYGKIHQSVHGRRFQAHLRTGGLEASAIRAYALDGLECGVPAFVGDCRRGIIEQGGTDKVRC